MLRTHGKSLSENCGDPLGLPICSFQDPVFNFGEFETGAVKGLKTAEADALLVVENLTESLGGQHKKGPLRQSSGFNLSFSCFGFSRQNT